MTEIIPQQEGVPMIELKPELIDQVRENLINSLEEAIEIYTEKGTKEWINKDFWLNVIKRIRKKESINITGQFWDEHIGDAIQDADIDHEKEREKFWAIREVIEQGS